MVTDSTGSISSIEYVSVKDQSIHYAFQALDLVVEPFYDPLTPDDHASVPHRLFVMANARRKPHQFGNLGCFRGGQPRRECLTAAVVDG